MPASWSFRQRTARQQPCSLFLANAWQLLEQLGWGEGLEGWFSYRASRDGITQCHDLDFGLGIYKPSLCSSEGYPPDASESHHIVTLRTTQVLLLSKV